MTNAAVHIPTSLRDELQDIIHRGADWDCGCQLFF